jgi:hypothetical protein
MSSGRVDIIAEAKVMHKEEIYESYQDGYQNVHEVAMSYTKTKEK